MSDKMTALVAHRFRTLGEPLRLKILQQLESGEKTVGELVENLDAGQPNISKHLGILSDAGLVARRRDGTRVLYAIGDPIVFRLCQLICRSETDRSRRTFEELSGETARQAARKVRK